MATSMIQQPIKTKIVQLSNLNQYADHTYYIEVPLYGATGLTAAQIISVTVAGWSGLGQYVGVGIGGSTLYVFHQPNYSITSSSYMTVLIAYYG